MLWIDRVRSRAYQMPKTMASATANTVVLRARGTFSWSVRMSVYRVPVTLSTTTVSQYAMGTYLGSRSCTTSTTASTTVNSSEVFSRPTPSVSLIQSAKLSPTVVHNTLMIQNQMTTSGTLLSKVRVDGSARVVEVVGAVIRSILPN